MAGLITDGTYVLGANIGEVSVDSSLTGKGTPDSPLGVNETVLYNNRTGRPTTVGGTITLSESPLNFKYVDVFFNGLYAEGTSNLAAGYKRLDSDSLTACNGIIGFSDIFLGNPAQPAGGTYEAGAGYSGCVGTNWTKFFGFVRNWNSTTAAANFTNNTLIGIYKVVGITRTANDN